MYKEETVFILGAGASWHYGYPTGSDLIQLVRKKASDLISFWDKIPLNLLSKCFPDYFGSLNIDENKDEDKVRSEFVRQCNDLKQRINDVNPLIIDYFLQQNSGLREIGKLLISYVLLEREQSYVQNRGNINRRAILENSENREDIRRAKNIVVKKCKDDWLKFVLHEMLSGASSSEDILKNKIHFITFNYDVSLENRLYEGFLPIEFISEDHKKELFEKENIILHIYGQIRENAFENEEFGKFTSIQENISSFDEQSCAERKKCLDKAWKAAQMIHTIPEQKRNNHDAISMAKKIISVAKTIYILGYGFDENNSNLTGLETLSERASQERKVPRKIYFTNYNDWNRVNKLAGSLLSDSEMAFVGKSLCYYEDGWRCEKSINDVYEALERDF